jgi:hypothetical protein
MPRTSLINSFIRRLQPQHLGWKVLSTPAVPAADVNRDSSSPRSAIPTGHLNSRSIVTRSRTRKGSDPRRRRAVLATFAILFLTVEALPFSGAGAYGRKRPGVYAPSAPASCVWVDADTDDDNDGDVDSDDDTALPMTSFTRPPIPLASSSRTAYSPAYYAGPNLPGPERPPRLQP